MKELHLQQNAVIKAVEPSKEKENILVIKGIASMYRTPEGFLQVDRDNELVNLDFMDLDSYKKNPILVFQHDWQKGIGKVTDIEHKNGALHITAEVHRLTGLEHIYEGVEKGIIKSLSLSTVPKSYTYHEVNGEDILEVASSTLVEISLTTVQSNQEALFDVVAKKSPTIAMKTVAKQNGMTCDELKGTCAFKAGLTEKELSTEKEENMALDEAGKQESEAYTDKAEAAAEDTPKKEVEVPKKEFDEEALAAAIVEAQHKTEELAKQKAEAEQLAAEEADKQREAEQKAFIESVKKYISDRKDEIVAIPDEDFDTELVEDFYEMVSNATEAIEDKVANIIKAQREELEKASAEA